MLGISRAALALFPIFLGAEAGEAGDWDGPLGFWLVTQLVWVWHRESGCSVSVREVGEGGAI